MRNLRIEEYIHRIEGKIESGIEIAFMAKYGIMRITIEALNILSENVNADLKVTMSTRTKIIILNNSLLFSNANK